MAGPWRGLSLLPALTVTLVWRFAYQAMDYGALQTGLYLDPGREPLRFLAVALVRAPLLLVGQLGWPDAEVWEILSPAARPIFYTAAWGFLAVAAIFLGPLVARSREARVPQPQQAVMMAGLNDRHALSAEGCDFGMKGACTGCGAGRRQVKTPTPSDLAASRG